MLCGSSSSGGSSKSRIAGEASSVHRFRRSGLGGAAIVPGSGTSSISSVCSPPGVAVNMTTASLWPGSVARNSCSPGIMKIENAENLSEFRSLPSIVTFTPTWESRTFSQVTCARAISYVSITARRSSLSSVMKPRSIAASNKSTASAGFLSCTSIIPRRPATSASS